MEGMAAQLQQIWSNMGNTRYYVIGVAAFMVLYLIGILLYMKRKKGQTQRWLQKNPTAVKVYVAQQSRMMRSEGLYISSVDGEKHKDFFEGMKTGFYVLPGTHVIESTFSSSRPGLLHKTVTTTYGPTKQEIRAEAGKSYKYYFDPKEKEYHFEEL